MSDGTHVVKFESGHTEVCCDEHVDAANDHDSVIDIVKRKSAEVCDWCDAEATAEKFSTTPRHNGVGFWGRS